MKISMKVINDNEVVITSNGKEYTVSKAAAFAISLIIPKYAEMIIENVMPIYKLFGLKPARVLLDEMKATALKNVPEAYAAAKEIAECEELEPMTAKMEYGEVLINITYDAVLDSMERHTEKLNKKCAGEDIPSEDIVHEDLPNRQEMN